MKVLFSLREIFSILLPFDDIYYFSAGGILGNVLSSTFLPYLSFVGSTLLFLLFTCAGFVRRGLNDAGFSARKRFYLPHKATIVGHGS